MDSIFIIFYLDMIYQTSLKLRPGTQDCQPQLNVFSFDIDLANVMSLLLNDIYVS